MLTEIEVSSLKVNTRFPPMPNSEPKSTKSLAFALNTIEKLFPRLIFGISYAPLGINSYTGNPPIGIFVCIVTLL